MTADLTTAKHWTVADYMAMEDDGRYEVLRGELRMVPAPGGAHQWALTALGARIHTFVDENELGWCFNAPFDVVLAEDIVVQPDFCFVRRERMRAIYDGHGLTGAPDLIIEALSKSTARLDRTTRRDIFAEAGVEWLVFVDPSQRTVEVHHLVEGVYELTDELGADDILTLAILPGFAAPLSKIWLNLDD